jgi:pentatricopeptide repeat protein
MTKTSDGQLMERDGLVGGALVEMYAKCGMLELARRAFSRLSAAKTASVWNSLLSGYAQYGDEQAAFAAFRDMSDAALRPDRSTFGALLSACVHSGLPELGQLCIAAMIRDWVVAPAIEHFLCIVELFGRAGDFERLAWVAETMPFPTGPGLWHAVLGAAYRKSDTCPEELVRWAFESALELDANDAVPYVFMSNAYASSAAGTHSSACTLSAL